VLKILSIVNAVIAVTLMRRVKDATTAS
jgi:hypothetical protein